MFDRRAFLLSAAGAAMSAAACGAPAQTRMRTFRPEDFGARGDGRSDDTAAFAALARALSQEGGGTVALRAATYRVGRQRQAGAADYAWAPDALLRFDNLPGAIAIAGNGARLQAAPGLRYGTFDRRTGRAVRRALPNMRRGEWATPYQAMIHISGARGPVLVEGLDLDGNLPALEIGGPWGDTGTQIPASGLLLTDNRAGEVVRDVRCRRHGQDGIMVAAPARRAARTRFENVACEDNGRQGLSIIGGTGFDIIDSRFARSARGPVSSAPGAGVDIEAEWAPIRDLRFTGCTMEANHGVGMVADSGDSANALFERCRFVGTVAHSLWPNKPDFRFRDCTFLGMIVKPFGDRNPARATQFLRCRFLDDPRRTSEGRVAGPFAGDLGENQNILFDACEWRLTHELRLPWSTGAIYRDCLMRQRTGEQAFPRGRYQGRTTIQGNVDLYGSRVEGDLTVNGRRVPRTA